MEAVKCIWCDEYPEEDYEDPVECKCRVAGCKWNYKWFPMDVWNQMNKPKNGEEKDPQEEIKRLKQWIEDLQSGVYVNCVYCGHRYGPEENTPVSRTEILKKHIEICPEHPMSALKKDYEELEKERNILYDLVKELREELMKLKAEKTFPIQDGFIGRKHYPRSKIPWWLAKAAYKVYAKRHGKDQTLERLAERGGFGREELLDLLLEKRE
jgi:hypothetical protein